MQKIAMIFLVAVILFSGCATPAEEPREFFLNYKEEIINRGDEISFEECNHKIKVINFNKDFIELEYPGTLLNMSDALDIARWNAGEGMDKSFPLTIYDNTNAILGGDCGEGIVEHHFKIKRIVNIIDLASCSKICMTGALPPPDQPPPKTYCYGCEEWSDF